MNYINNNWGCDQRDYNIGILPDKADEGKCFTLYNSDGFPHIINENILSITQKLHISIPVIFQTVWGVVLQKYNDVDNVTFFTLKNQEVNLCHFKTTKNTTKDSLLLDMQKEYNEKKLLNPSDVAVDKSTLFVYSDNELNFKGHDWGAPIQIYF